MPRPLEGGLEIAAPPVVSGVQEGGLPGEHGPHLVKIIMAGGYKSLDLSGIQLGCPLGGPAQAQARPAQSKPAEQSDKSLPSHKLQV
jgi:hypothetical protein